MPESIEPVVFGEAVRALLKDHAFTAAEQRELQALGIELDKAPATAYPFHVWPKAINVAAKAMFKGLDLPQAKRALGQRYIRLSTDHFLTKALIPLTQLIGPRRFLARMGRNMKTTFNYIEGEVVKDSPGDVVLKLFAVSEAAGKVKGTDWLVPEFFEGAIHSILVGFAGAKDCTVQTLEVDPERAKLLFHINWKS
jgi:uncharacterized protein (TIGR02265 family)